MYEDKTASHFVIDVAGATSTYAQVATFRCNVQPASPSIIALFNGVFGKTFTVFTTYSGLNTNDLITTSGTPTYSGTYFRVLGVMDNGNGVIPHFQVVVTRPN